MEERAGGKEDWTRGCQTFGIGCAEWGRVTGDGFPTGISGCAIQEEQKYDGVVIWTRVSHVNVCSEINPEVCRWGNVTPFYTKLMEIRKTVISSTFEL